MHALAPLPPPPAVADDWGLFLDVDGTLLDFAAHPEQVHVPAGLTDALAVLQQRLDDALALVSGRPLRQLDALFAPLHLAAAGLHGLEHRDEDAKHEPSSLLRILRTKADILAMQFPGSVVEDKGPSLALHWRGNPAAAEPLQTLAESAMPWLPDYRLQPGDHVLELRPKGADKGLAIQAMMDTPRFRGRRPVFVGDDHTDEHGFAAVRARDGIAVLVGSRNPTVATFRLHDTHAVREWLQRGAKA